MAFPGNASRHARLGCRADPDHFRCGVRWTKAEAAGASVTEWLFLPSRPANGETPADHEVHAGDELGQRHRRLRPPDTELPEGFAAGRYFGLALCSRSD